MFSAYLFEHELGDCALGSKHRVTAAQRRQCSEPLATQTVSLVCDLCGRAQHTQRGSPAQRRSWCMPAGLRVQAGEVGCPGPRGDVRKPANRSTQASQSRCDSHAGLQPSPHPAWGCPVCRLHGAAAGRPGKTGPQTAAGKEFVAGVAGMGRDASRQGGCGWLGEGRHTAAGWLVAGMRLSSCPRTNGEERREWQGQSSAVTGSVRN